MSNYPPGVTGNEPQITGEWPCDVCGGHRPDVEDCDACKGTGIIPEENIAAIEVLQLLKTFFKEQGWGAVYMDTDNDALTFHTDLKNVGGGWVREED